MNNIFDDIDNLIDWDDPITSRIFPLSYTWHLLVSSWTVAPIDDICKLMGISSSQIRWKDNFFCIAICIETWLNYKTKQVVFDKNFEENLKRLLKKCGYLNIALAYQKKDDKTISYILWDKISKQSHIKKLRKKIQNQYNRIDKLVTDNLVEPVLGCSLDAPSRYVLDKIGVVKNYLYTGIEQLTYDHFNSQPIADLFTYLQNINEFFLGDDSVIPGLAKQAFHLFHHPGKSFPLPILLKSDSDMPILIEPKHLAEWEDVKNENIQKCIREVKIINKILGYYTREDENACIGPHITLCPKRIEDNAKQIRIAPELLYLIVLIHELGHALMDNHRVASSLDSLQARAMEESLANCITLQWFAKYLPKELSNVKKFISKQPIIYQFGLKQYKAEVDWKLWRDSFKNMHTLLAIWFKRCFGVKNPKLKTVQEAYENVFDFNLENLLDFFEQCATNIGILTTNSIKSYKSYVNKGDEVSNHELVDWIAKTILTSSQDITSDLINKIKSLNISDKYKSGVIKFAYCIIGFYQANYWMLIRDKSDYYCRIVAENALFASQEVVERIKKGQLGGQENLGKGNPYASWDRLVHARNNQETKGKAYQDKVTPSNIITNLQLSTDIIADDNTIANQAIKKAIIESYRRKGIESVIDDISLFKDYEACHVWDRPSDRRYYASIANLILLPRALAQLTDHCDEVKELLRYEVFRRFGFKPDEEKQGPKQPTKYARYKWRTPTNW